MDIIIFKAGRILGPLDHDRVSGMLARGEVSENDLAQSGGVEVWVPLRRLFPASGKPSRIESAKRHFREAGMSFWAALHFNPLRVGLASLLGGCILIIFQRWTFFLFVPALASAVFAGAILLTRGHCVSGILLSLASLILPGIFLVAGRDDSGARSPLRFFLPPSMESVLPAKPNTVGKPTPLARHRGLALPQPVRPPPTPRPVPPI